MANEERKMIICEQRNTLVSNLLTVYPGSLSGEKLFMVMLGSFPAYDRLNCFKDLVYLEQKGYVIRKHPLTGKSDPTAEWKDARWTLTASGNEVGNKLIEDPALEV